MMPKILDIEQRSLEWYDLRKKCITATDIAIIMGISEYKTPYQLWQEKLNLKDSESETEAMRRGRDLEPKALEAYSSYRSYIDVTPIVATHSLYEWAMASIDGYSQAHNRICEIKCMGKKNHDEAMTGIVKPLYMYQMQWQMFVMDLQECDYFVFSEESYEIFRISRDQELIDKMIVEAEEFLRKIETLTPPEMTDRDYVDRSNDPYFDSLMEDYMDSANRENLHKAEKERYRDLLIEYTSDKNTIGSFGKFTKSVMKGRISYSDIPELKNVDLEKYRGKDIVSYRITIKKENE
jgi:putative phage-type endonuclease